MIESPKHLASITKIPVSRIKQIEKEIGNFYDFFYKTKRDYVTHEIIFENGIKKKRPIHPSLGDLNQLQIYLAIFINSKLQLPNCVHGGVKKRGCATYILPHISHKYHFCTDLRNFFPSVTYEKVVKVFLEIGCSKRIANRLAKLTTYYCPEPNKQSSTPIIPQGTPSASIITNLAFHRTDKGLLEFCDKNKIIYTRYVDDLCFSSDKEFKPDVINGIIGIIKSNGFEINRNKTVSRKGTFEAVGIRANRLGITHTNKQKEKIEYLLANPKDKRSKNIKSLQVDYKKSIKRVLKELKKENKKKIFHDEPDEITKG